MNWISTCGGSKAGNRYQRRVMTTMAIYLALLFAAVFLVKHGHVHGALLYVASIVPAVPVILVLGWMGLYLQEETDEYLRVMTMRSLLVGTGAVLGLIVVSDFLRSIAERPALPPFTCFVVFFMSFGIAQGVQRMRNRASDE